MKSKPVLSEVSQLPEDAQDLAQKQRNGRILGELSKRKVCRTAISYILVMWLNLQIGDVIFPMMGLPEWALRLIIVIGIMGFPVVLIIAWAFQITPEGIVLESQDSQEDPAADRQLDMIVNLLLLLSSVALSILLVLQFFSDGKPLSAAKATSDGKIVVSSLTFDAASGEESNALLASGVLEELRHRLILLEGVEVIPDNSAWEPIHGHQLIALSGSVLLDDETAHVLAHLIDLTLGQYLTSVSFNVKYESLLAAETTTADRIMSEFENSLLTGR